MKKKLVVSPEEINDLLQDNRILEIYVNKKIGDKYELIVTYKPDADKFSEWSIDVWNCHGVLKKTKWGLGYGSTPELPESAEWKDIGYFSIPVVKGSDVSEMEVEKIEKILFDVLHDRGGAINMSGFYPVFKEEMEKIQKILKDRLYS